MYRFYGAILRNPLLGYVAVVFIIIIAILSFINGSNNSMVTVEGTVIEHSDTPQVNPIEIRSNNHYAHRFSYSYNGEYYECNLLVNEVHDKDSFVKLEINPLDPQHCELPDRSYTLGIILILLAIVIGVVSTVRMKNKFE